MTGARREPPPAPEEAQEGDPPGAPFGSWGALYGSLAVYGALTILVLWLLTVALSPDIG